MARLKNTAAEFAQKESQLSRDLKLRRLAESRKHREETEGVENWLAEETAKVEARFAENQARVLPKSLQVINDILPKCQQIHL